MDLYEKYGLRRVINAYDKATFLGGARVLPEIAEVVTKALADPFELSDLQRAAGRRIAEETGAEWGCVTACAAAGITLGVAACMTGKNMGRIAQLPDTSGMPNRVVIQKGHCVSFGAPVAQMIRLSGAMLLEAGNANGCSAWNIEHELAKGNIAAVMAVESYHTVRYNGVRLPELAQIAQAAGVPLVVDAATQELRLREIVGFGADLVGSSAHKYFGATTAGIVAGRRDLVEAVDLQHQGIGRPMKAGKEGIFGVLAAFDAPMWRNTDEWSRWEQAKIARIVERLASIPGLTVKTSPDPNGCPFTRACLQPDPVTTGHTASSLRAALLEQEPAIYTRIYHAADNELYLNATEMTAGEGEFVCDRIAEVLHNMCAKKC